MTGRILHLIDLHLRHHQFGTSGVSDRQSRKIPQLLDRLAALVPSLNVDGIVLSGDLLDVPDEVIAGGSADGHSREDWLAAVERDLQLIRKWLLNLGLDYVICPGNHDYEPLTRQVFPEAREFADMAGLRFVSFWDELGSDRRPLRTGARLELFETALTAPEHDVPQVHVQHYIIYPPTFRDDWRYDYVGSDEFKKRLEQSNRVRAVLSGHYHRGIWEELGGIVYSGPPAFCETPHRFRVYDFTDDGGVRCEDLSVDGGS